MSEELLKRFYTKILKLLQNTQQGINEGQIAATLEAFQDYTDKNTISQALIKLGLADIHAFIEALQGHDIHTLDATHVVPNEIFVNYLEQVLPILEKNLKEMEQSSLPPILRTTCQNLIRQIRLFQQMHLGVQKNDIFPIMHSLIAAYPNQSPELKSVIVSTLKLVGTPVVLALVDSLYHEKNEKHSDLPELLKEIGYLAVPALIIALNYPEEKVRYASAEVLKKMKAREALPALVDTLKDTSWRVRKAAAEALGEIRSSRAINGLIEALNDKDASVRLEVIRSLGKLNDSKILKALIPVLEDASWEVRRACVEAASKFGPIASNFLARALQNDSLVVRKIAARILVEIGTLEAIPALMKAVHDRDISVRERAVVALGRIKGEDALVNLMYALEDKAPLVRFASVQALISIGTRDALPILNNALKDPEQIIRQRAKFAIETILKRLESGTNPNC